MSRAHYTPYTGPALKRIYYIKHVGPGQDIHQVAYDQPISTDQLTGRALTSTVICLPGTYPTAEDAAYAAARLNLGLVLCKKCGHLYQPEDLTDGLCCACSAHAAEKRANTAPAAGKQRDKHDTSSS